MTIDTTDRRMPSRRNGPVLVLLLAVLAAATGATAPAASPTVLLMPRPLDRGGDVQLTVRPPAGSAPIVLTGLAEHLAVTADDQQSGTDSCTVLRRTTIRGGQPVNGDSVRVMHRDGSGLLLERPATARAWTRTTYPPGALLAGLDEPLPDDPLTLARLVQAAAPSAAGSTGLVAVLADLASVRYLDLAHRRAVLRILATLPGSSLLAPATMRPARRRTGSASTTAPPPASRYG